MVALLASCFSRFAPKSNAPRTERLQCGRGKTRCGSPMGDQPRCTGGEAENPDWSK